MRYSSSVVSELDNLLSEINDYSQKIICNSSKLLISLRNDEHLSLKKKRNLITKIVELCIDAQKVCQKKDALSIAISTNNFDEEPFFQELWFGDLYDKTGVDALKEFLNSLKENYDNLEKLELTSSSSSEQYKEEEKRSQSLTMY